MYGWYFRKLVYIHSKLSSFAIAPANFFEIRFFLVARKVMCSEIDSSVREREKLCSRNPSRATGVFISLLENADNVLTRNEISR